MADDRLEKIAAMVPQCARFADIGTDHGYLPLHLFRIGRIGFAELTDISAPSLQKAVSLMEKCGYSDRCAFSVGDGCRALSEKPDCAVIAGMGGMLISKIVTEGRDMLSRVIVQPNLDVPKVRRALVEAGFCIVDEAFAHVGRRHYVIVCAEKGRAEYSPEEYEVGPILLRRGDPLMHSYAAFRVKVLQKALRGAEATDPEAAEALKWELDVWQRRLDA